MSKENTSTTPTISVAEALGLPDKWSLRDSIASGAPVVESEPTPADDPPAETETPAATETTDEAPPETPAGEEPAPAADPAAGGEKPESTRDESGKFKKKIRDINPRAAADKKPKAQSSRDDDTPADKKDTKKKKDDAATVAAAKPAADAPAAETPAAPAVVEPKFKVGDKEYTESELQALIASKKAAEAPPATNPAKPAEPAAKPTPPKKDVAATPAAPEKVLTPEEKAAKAAQIEKEESEWIEHAAPNFKVSVPEETLDAILAGGPDGAKALTETIRRAAAEAHLHARKTILEDMNKTFERVRDRIQPLLDTHTQSEVARVENSFKAKYPALADYMDDVNAIGTAIGEVYDLSKMNEDEYFDLVAQETSKRIQRYNKGFSLTPAAAPVDTSVAPPVVTAKPAAPAAAAPAPKPAAKPAAPVVRPPGGNAPGAAGATKGGSAKQSDKEIIATLL